MRENFVAARLIPHLGTPEDIAAAGVAFLLSDDASFCTGETLPVDGRWTSKGQHGLRAQVE